MKGRAVRIRTIAVTAVAAGCLVAAPPAFAAGWARVTTPDGSSIDQVSIARSADGTLHVAWHRPTGPSTEDLLHTAISARGKVGATTLVATGWASIEDPGLVVVPGGLRVFFGGIRTTNTSEPNQELNTALSVDAGASWALQTGSVVPRGAQAYGSTVSASTLPDGTTLQAWAGTLGTWVHGGLSPAAPNRDYQAPLGAYGYDPGIATDASGQTVMAWYSNAAGHLGVLAQPVASDGSPVGSATTMPGTNAMAVGVLARTPIVARRRGGFYVAYPTGHPTMNRIRVWRVGAGTAPIVARTSGQGNQPAAVAATADGRIWVAWADNVNGTPRVLARRSNRSGSRFGATVAAGRVRGSLSAYALDASAAPDGRLDLLAAFGIGTSPNAATYHRRIRPGLTVAARPARLRRGGRTDVRFTVTDAGDPVKGARVTAAGASGKTNGKGRVTLTLRGSGSRLAAKATRTGYVSASTRLRVRG
jgi:hypothetical protein